MEIPNQIDVLLKDVNNDCIKLKLDTEPFISGSIKQVVNWMVLNPLGNVDMPDIQSGITLFFLACRYNPNNELIIWLIESCETKLSFTNSDGDTVLEYLAKSEFNSPKISARIKLLMSYHLFDLDRQNKYNDSLFDILCYSGYIDIVKYILSNGYEPGQEKQTKLINQVNEIITGECDDYWSTYEIDEDHFYRSLEGIMKLLELKFFDLHLCK